MSARSLKLDVEEREELEKNKKHVGRRYKDPLKHFVRTYGWLPIAKERMKNVKKKGKDGGLRYFTLPGEYAIDILFFDREGLLEKKGNKYSNVVYTESDSDILTEIQKKLHGTKWYGVLFEELVKNPDFIALIKKKPFDIINLDFTRNPFFHEEPPFSSTLQSMETILSLQRKSFFDIFVTFSARRSNSNDEAIAQLNEKMEENLSRSKEICKFYGKITSEDIENFANNNYPMYLLTVFPKTFARFALDYDLELHTKMKFIYSREDNWGNSYHIIKFIFSITPIKYRKDDKKIESKGEKRNKIEKELTINSLKIKVVNVEKELKTNQSLRNKLIKDVKSLIV